jgi:hypothetical protein
VQRGGSVRAGGSFGKVPYDALFLEAGSDDRPRQFRRAEHRLVELAPHDKGAAPAARI